MRWRACDNTYLTCMEHDGGDQRSRGADLGGGGSHERCKSKKEKKKNLWCLLIRSGTAAGGRHGCIQGVWTH